ncbi:MAG: SgcJ/EcaC family oxidoreductase [Myxococcota bacterium]
MAVGVLAVLAVAHAGEAETHDALRAVKAEMERALNARDIDAIVAHSTPDVVFTAMNGDVVQGRDGVRAYFDKMMNGSAKVVESIDATFAADALSVLKGDDTAISWGTSNAHFVLVDGEDFEVNARWSATLVRDPAGSDWQVASFHYSTGLWDNPIVAAANRWAMTAGVAVAFVAGAAGAIAGFLVGRRRG